MDNETLKKMWECRFEFIDKLNEAEPKTYPDLPLDISQKESQKFLRDIIHRSIEEQYETLQHLKNWKDHRVINEDDTQFEKEKYVEEIVDSFNYMLSALIYVGIGPNEFCNAFFKKHGVIMKRADDLIKKKNT